MQRTMVMKRIVDIEYLELMIGCKRININKTRRKHRVENFITLVAP
jgi:hypothetical protein